ncbi:helix-turn-helix domain-containing protein [Microbacterium sp. ZXX196]|uniref:helix-turn-helix domain-containing protein n=1 Tax=Microbacterium sp. ZXX196 TaxID=2609291 RepID=UPI0012B86F87|nr:helix-turn-helix domain-containing protein [Microbacterium sp. ZXX196]MTE24870.1 helix-turn-helix domain-containing protein [Microbacterium sp. ZXX196]
MGRPPKKTSEFDAKLGAVVRSKRIKRGISQAQAAEASGVPLSNYQRREAGTNEITVSELKRIAAVVGVTAAEMADEALKDFGGIDKLIAEHVGMSATPPSLDEHRQQKAAEMLVDELEGQPRKAATYDTDLEKPEPELP